MSAWVVDAVKLREVLSDIIEPLKFSILVPETDAKVWLGPDGLREVIEEALGIKVRVAVLPYPIVSGEIVAHYICSQIKEEIEVDCCKVEVEESPGEVAVYDECLEL